MNMTLSLSNEVIVLAFKTSQKSSTF